MNVYDFDLWINEWMDGFMDKSMDIYDFDCLRLRKVVMVCLKLDCFVSTWIFVMDICDICDFAGYMEYMDGIYWYMDGWIFVIILIG